MKWVTVVDLRGKDCIMRLFPKLKNDKKGFTLVEMIVVIVIIGILLAILVPGMFKYIDKAKDKRIQVNARTAYLNLKEAVVQIYSQNGVTSADIKGYFKDDTIIKNKNKGEGCELVIYEGTETDSQFKHTYVMIPFDNDDATITKVQVNDQGEVLGMTYTENGKQITLDEHGWTDVAPAPSGE